MQTVDKVMVHLDEMFYAEATADIKKNKKKNDTSSIHNQKF